MILVAEAVGIFWVLEKICNFAFKVGLKKGANLCVKRIFC